MDSRQTDKYLDVHKRKAAAQLKRRDTYSQMPYDKKEELLLARRRKKQDSVKYVRSQNSTTADQEQPTSSWFASTVTRHTALTIREPLIPLGKAVHADPSVGTSANNKKKKKNICSPFVISETGGPSNVFNQHLQAQNAISTKDTRQGKRMSPATTKQRSEYVPLKKPSSCQYCGAKKLEYEPLGFCCSSGSIRLISYKMPTELSKLYFEKTEESENFQTYIRTYNNMFAFTSLGVRYDKELARRNSGICIFRVQEKMYHFIDDLIPSNDKPRNLQLYFYDHDNELPNRMACSNKVDQFIVQKLMDILNVNPYSTFLRSLFNLPKLSDFYIALKCDSTLDQRTHNLPTSSEVTTIWVEENSTHSFSAPHI